jgi:hypothetical protein
MNGQIYYQWYYEHTWFVGKKSQSPDMALRVWECFCTSLIYTDIELEGELYKLDTLCLNVTFAQGRVILEAIFRSRPVNEMRKYTHLAERWEWQESVTVWELAHTCACSELKLASNNESMTWQQCSRRSYIVSTVESSSCEGVSICLRQEAWSTYGTHYDIQTTNLGLKTRMLNPILSSQ